MEGIKKLQELMHSDETFQQKLKDALASYSGEQSEEAIFDAVLTPLAKEYDISATYEEFKELKGTHTLSEDELEQVSGGIDSIFGIPLCGIFGDTNKNDCPCPMGIGPDRLSQ